jgi:hypothetical protein
VTQSTVFIIIEEMNHHEFLTNLLVFLRIILVRSRLGLIVVFWGCF